MLLSIGPITALYARGTIRWSAAPWCARFYAPAYWLCDKTGLVQPLNDYMDWWIRALK